MTKCDCIDPERHGHLDDCPFSEIERLRSRLADIESQNRVMWDVANDREARLAEAEALLSSDTVGLPYWCEQRDAFLAPDSAPAADRIDPADLLEIMERCPVCTAEFVKHCRKRAADRE